MWYYNSMTTRASENAPRIRPDIVYSVSWIDISVKDPSDLMAQVHELLHIEHAMAIAQKRIKGLHARLDELTRMDKVRETASESRQTPYVSRIKVYRRTNTEGEDPFVDWKVPNPKTIPDQRVTTNDPAETLIDELTSWNEMLGQLCQAAYEYGEEIDAAVRAAGAIPDHILNYKAQAVAGSAGWKFESTFERRIEHTYRVYA